MRSLRGRPRLPSAWEQGVFVVSQSQVVVFIEQPVRFMQSPSRLAINGDAIHDGEQLIITD
jgi:hypothetical protein